VSERTATLSDWQTPEGGATELGPLPVEDEELCPPDALEEMEPDELSFAEATGNEGASFERTYRRAALVVWPRQQWLAVLAQAGVRTTLPYLAELTRQWEERAAAALWEQAHELSRQMLRQWPRPWSYPSDFLHGAPGDAATMLRLLTRLRDVETIAAFLTTVTAEGVYGRGDNKAAEADRQHVEGTIRASECDLDIVTERTGRPYSLVCTKNQASYERRVQQRTADLAALAQLED
jgi:hypothetical protein